MINTANISRAYSEVYEFINALGEEYINKLPKSIYDTIKDNRDINYKPEYDKNQKLTNEIISKEALALISAINLQYWCKDVQEKERLKQAYYENTKKEEEKYSYDNIFKNNTIQKEKIPQESEMENTQIIEYKSENIFEKILSKIKSIFLKFKK